MGFKNILKTIVGAERLSNIKGIVCHYGCSFNLALNRQKKMWFSEQELQLCREFSAQNFHVFRGYYDIEYLNVNGDSFLCHRLPLLAQNNRSDKCEIGCYSIRSGEFKKIAETSAWCWQQGSRLRWHPLNSNYVVFNDVERENYCTKIFDTISNKCVDVLPHPLYDFTSDFKFGLSLNFSRLQRLRPGYGYDYFEDRTINESAPETDGIMLVNLEEKQSKLLFSLQDLARKVDQDNQCVHYINHISIAPDGKHFMFFHIYFNPKEEGWKTVLYVASMNGEELVALEKQDRSSHYCWIDNENLMVTCRKENGEEYYCTFNILTQEKRIIETNGLHVDGHPSPVGDSGLFITDTYPQKNSIQKLQTFQMEDVNVKESARVYHDYRLRGEKRCDLHPAISGNGKYISFDTTYQKKKRSIIVFERLVEEKEWQK